MKKGTESAAHLTKREFIATHALSGMIAGSVGLVISPEEFAEQSVKLADALLVELGK